MKIVEDDLTRNSPPESVHALELSDLQGPDITFWTAWEDTALLGFGALRHLGAGLGEIKSMRTARAHLGRGVGSEILRHIISVARARSYLRLNLETGSGPAFEPALNLYRKAGFEFCGPFGDYTDDPFSRFMTLEL